MSKILITDGLDQAGLAVLRQAARVDELTGITAENLLAAIPEYDGLIVRGRSRVTAELITAAATLKVVGRAGVGVDNIDLVAAAKRGVIVVNAPTSTSIAVAELAFGLLLSVAREIPRADAFGMTVLGYDPLLAADEIVRRGGRPVDLDGLYSRSDFISLHLPLDANTHGMISAEAIGRMKWGVRLVCAARGGIIDEAALLAGLEEGKVAAAGLDVFAAEPPGLTRLVAHPGVVACPHIGAQTVESQSRASLDIADEVLAALRGEALRWKVA